MGQLKAWSYSRWETHEQCPKKAQFKFVDKIPEPSSAALENGDQVHKILAQYMRGDLPVNDPIPGWTYWQELYKQLRAMEPMIEQEWAFDHRWREVGWFDKEAWIRSKLDVFLPYDDATADVVDYKTGKPNQKVLHQAELYFLSVISRYPDIHNVTVRFWYTDLDQAGREDVFRFSRSEHAPMLFKRWNKRGETVTGDNNMPPIPGTHCKWCPFAKSKDGPCKYG